MGKTINYPLLTVDSTARLTSVPDAIRAGVMQHFTLDNPEYVEAVRRNRRGASEHPPTIKYFWIEKDALVFPRGEINRVLAFCRSCNIRMAINDKRISPLPIDNLEFTGRLRDYQEEAVEDALKNEFGVIEAATGAGKTVIACALICKRSCSSLILIHSKDLLYQWRERLVQYTTLKEDEIGLVGDGLMDIKPITVAIVNSAANIAEQLKGNFSYLIVDEAHRAATAMYIDSLLTKLPTRFMTGLSATPFRRDGRTKLLNWFLGQNVHKVDPERLRDINAVMRPLIYQKPTAFTYEKAQKNYQGMISAMVNDDARNALIVKEVCADVCRTSGNGVTLIVSDRTGHLEILRDLLLATSIPSSRIALLTGSTKPDLRKAITEQLKNGEISVLIASLQLISEGYDAPSLSSVHLATPVSWKARIIQTVGRVLRPEEGKEPVVVDYVDLKIGLLEHRANQRMEIFTREIFGTKILEPPWETVKGVIAEVSEVPWEKKEIPQPRAVKINRPPGRLQQLSLPGMQAAA